MNYGTQSDQWPRYLIVGQLSRWLVSVSRCCGGCCVSIIVPIRAPPHNNWTVIAGTNNISSARGESTHPSHSQTMIVMRRSMDHPLVFLHSRSRIYFHASAPVERRFRVFDRLAPFTPPLVVWFEEEEDEGQRVVDCE